MKKGAAGAIGLLKGLKLRDFAPEAPAIANYTTGEVMGHSSDRLAARFGISRHDQDEFTVMSHTRAAKAHKNGIYQNEIIPVDGCSEENGIKGDSTMEKVSKLKPGSFLRLLFFIYSLIYTPVFPSFIFIYYANLLMMYLSTTSVNTVKQPSSSLMEPTRRPIHHI